MATDEAKTIDEQERPDRPKAPPVKVRQNLVLNHGSEPAKYREYLTANGYKVLEEEETADGRHVRFGFQLDQNAPVTDDGGPTAEDLNPAAGNK